VPPDPNSLCWALRSTPSCGGTAQGGKEGTGRLTFTCADGSMKLRVRTADGGTLRVEADKTCSVCSFVAQLELPPGQEASRADLGLSLNKKDLLNPDTTLEANGIRGGDLVHLVSMAGYGGIGSPSRPGQAAAAAAAAPAASAAAAAGASAAPGAAAAPAPPRSNLFGLPTAAPTSDEKGGPAATLVRDSTGRVWQESVVPTSRPAADASGAVVLGSSASAGAAAGRQREDTAEESRRQRLLAIERRLGPLGAHKRDRPETDSPSTLRQDSGPQLQRDALSAAAAGFKAAQTEISDMFTALLRKHGLAPASLTPADVCVLGVNCCMSKAGYQASKGSDAGLASHAWKGKGGSYSFYYTAELEGAKTADLTLKCLDMGKELIVHAAVPGQETRANMRCTISEHVSTASLGAEPSLMGRGQGLMTLVNSKLLAPLNRQGLSPPKLHSSARSATADTEMQDVNGQEGDVETVDGRGRVGFAGLVDQKQTFAVFRQGLAFAKSLPHVQTASVEEGAFLFLSVHVLLCCAGLSPQRKAQGHNGSSSTTTPSAAAAAAAAAAASSSSNAAGTSCIEGSAAAGNGGSSLNPEWELVEGGGGQADWEIVDKDCPTGDDDTVVSNGHATSVPTICQGFPEALKGSIAALPHTWHRNASGGSHCVLYHAAVEGGSAALAVKAIQLNGRLFVHARVAGAGAGASMAPTARCAFLNSEMVAKIDGECVLTDEALEKLLVMVSRRLLGPIGRAIRACEAPNSPPSTPPRPHRDTEASSTASAAGGLQVGDTNSRRAAAKRRVSFSSLYSELKIHVLAHLPGRVLGVVAQVARKLNSLAKNDLLWGFLVVRDFGKPWSFSSAPLTAADGGDHTWRGTYRALLLKRQLRRTAGMHVCLRIYMSI